MKTLMRGLTLAAMLLAVPATQASIVIDDFIDAGHSAGGINPASTAPPLAIGNGVTRTMSVDSVSSSFGVDGAGAMSLNLATVGSWGEVTYDLTGFTGNRNFFVDQILRIGLVNAFNPVSITTAFTVTAAGFTTGTATTTTAGMPSQFSMTGVISGPGGNGHLAALQNVDTLTIRFTRANAGLGAALPAVFSSTTGVSAVPEPASMALLGLTAVGGFFAHRRRKNQLAA